MSRLTTNDLRVFLADLLRGPKRATLDAIPAAAGYAAIVERTLSAIEALPPAPLGGVPNAEALESTDERHDGFGTALWHLAQAILAYPDATDEQKVSAKFILEKVVAAKGELRASYATEAARSAERRPAIEADREVLERIAVLDTNAYAWATSFLDAGAMLATLLSGRADQLVDRSPAAALRGKAIGQIRKLRSIVADAHEDAPREAARLDALLFGFYDLLEGMRRRGSTEPTPAPPPAPAPAS
ncbi:MAG TPA: hypothetical protein VIL20_30500 [Sandaracinaceae bacterium]